MRDRLPMIFSTTALLVAVLGVTPLGELPTTPSYRGTASARCSSSETP